MEEKEANSMDRKYHTFRRTTMKLKELLPLLRSGAYSNYDDAGTSIIICPECEEWTHVKFNLNSGLLIFLGELTVENIDAKDDDIQIWIKTDDFNWLNVDGQ